MLLFFTDSERQRLSDTYSVDRFVAGFAFHLSVDLWKLATEAVESKTIRTVSWRGGNDQDLPGRLAFLASADRWRAAGPATRLLQSDFLKNQMLSL